jgi:hypothetical protein
MFNVAATDRFRIEILYTFPVSLSELYVLHRDVLYFAILALLGDL